MTVLSILACAGLLWQLLRPGAGSVLVAALERFAPTRAYVAIASAAIVLLYAGQLAGDFLRTRFENVAAHYAWMNELPLPVYDLRGIASMSPAMREIFSTTGLALGVLQTVALAVIVLAIRRNDTAISRQRVATLASTMALLSLLAPAMSSTDPYEYVATGLLGLRAYTPSSGAFTGTMYDAIAKHIPLTGVIYGPLWVLVDTAQTALGASVAAKIEAIRMWNVAFVGLTIWLFARCGLSRAALVAFALNPAVWYFAVAVPHADIEAVTLLAAAYVSACRSKTLLATVYLAAAGLVKLPFVLAGGALLSPLSNVKRRCTAWIFAVVLVAGLSYAVAGGAYAASLSHYAAVRTAMGWSHHWMIFTGLFAAATFIMLAFRRGLLSAAWLFHQAAPIAAPWYIFWGIPYAVAAGGLELYLIAFPLAATQTAIVDTGSQMVALIGIMIVALDVAASRYRVLKSAYLERRVHLGQPPRSGA